MSDPVRDLKRELLAAAERQHRHVAVSTGRPRLQARLARHRLLLTSAILAVAAAVALLVTTPWNSSPGFLEKAQAALAPQAGMILHKKWELTTTSADPACTVKHAPNEIWVDQTPPYRYRALLDDLPDPVDADSRALVCSRPTMSEFGGTLDPVEMVKFVPPNALRAAGQFQFQFGTPPDPVTQVREAISAGTAHDEGKTQLDGRTVERIRIDPPSDCAHCSREPAYAYVDPETFYPVRIKSHAYIVPPDRPIVRLDAVVRSLTFEYLPRTAANLALTDIRAQHPDATGP
jgi:hypothetical protein